MPSFWACAIATFIAPAMSLCCNRYPMRMVLLAGDEPASVTTSWNCPITTSRGSSQQRRPIFSNISRDVCSTPDYIIVDRRLRRAWQRSDNRCVMVIGSKHRSFIGRTSSTRVGNKPRLPSCAVSTSFYSPSSSVLSSSASSSSSHKQCADHTLTR